MKTASSSILLLSLLLTSFLGKCFPDVSLEYPTDRQLVCPALSLARVLNPTDGYENRQTEPGKFNKSRQSQLARGQWVKCDECYTRLLEDIRVAPSEEVGKWFSGAGWLEDVKHFYNKNLDLFNDY